MARSGLPLTYKSADPDDTRPECFTNIDNYPDTGDHEFSFALDVTNCSDGTFCPSANNQTCCFDHQGVKLISYHYDAALPTAAAALSTFYTENGYEIATTASSSSTILPITSPSSAISVFPSTSAPISNPTATFPPNQNNSSPLDVGKKAGIGIGVGVGTLAIAGMFLLLLRRVRRHRRDNTRHSRALGTFEMVPPDARQWERPELIGEDARKDMGAEERRKAELPGEVARTETGSAEIRPSIAHELQARS